MSIDLNTYFERRNEIRGKWTTHPPYHRAERNQKVKLMQLAYALSCIIKRLKQ